MKRKNYFSGLFSAIGIIPILIVAVGVAAVCHFALKPNVLVSFRQSQFFGTAIGYLGFALVLALSAIAYVDLGNRKITNFDLFRVGGFLGTGGALALNLWKTQNNFGTIVYICGLALMCIAILVRLIRVRECDSQLGIKGYTASLYNFISPIFLCILAVGATVVLYYFRDGNEHPSVYKCLTTYGYLYAIVAVALSILLSLNKKLEKANFLDALFAIGFEVSILALLFTANDKGYATVFVTMLAATGLALLIRGASFSGKYEAAYFKINRYFADEAAHHGIVFQILFPVALVGLFIYSVTRDAAPILDIFKFVTIDFTKFASFMPYVVLGVIALAVLLVIILRDLKNPEITKVDFVVSVMMRLSVYLAFVVAYTVKSAYIDKTITLEPLGYGIYGTMCAFILFSIIIQLVRLGRYQGILSIAEAEEAKAEETEEAPVEEEPIQEEPVQEEVVEETPVEEEPAQEEPVQEEVVEEAPVEEEVEEEIIYVDENGNPVDAPVEGEEVEEEIIYVDEDGNIIENPEDYEELVEDEEEEVEEEEAEDEEDEAEAEPEEEKESIEVNDFEITDSEGNVKKIRKKFNTRMMYADPEAKEYYSEVKNYLVMYRARGRYSSRCETFRYKGLVAKVALAGKSIKVFLAIDPASLVDSKYHFKDMSEKKQYAEVPTMIKVRSPRGLKYFKELVDLMMAARAVKPKKNFEPTDYASDLIPNGEAILGKFGLPRDYQLESVNVDSIPQGLPENLENYIPQVSGEPLTEEEQEAVVYLDTLCHHFLDGDTVNLQTLKSLHVVQAGNVLRIKARGTIDRKLKIYAEHYDENALQMLLVTNSTAIKVVR